MSAAAATPELDFLDLSYRPDLRVLTVRWLRAVGFEELQAGFQAAVALNEQYRASRWLVDVRRRTELDAASSTWVAQTLLPTAAAALVPAPLFVAYLLAPARAEQLQTDSALRNTTASAQLPTQPYRLVTFLDEGPAVHWLLAQPV